MIKFKINEIVMLKHKDEFFRGKVISNEKVPFYFAPVKTKNDYYYRYVIDLGGSKVVVNLTKNFDKLSVNDNEFLSIDEYREERLRKLLDE